MHRHLGRLRSCRQCNSCNSPLRSASLHHRFSVSARLLLLLLMLLLPVAQFRPLTSRLFCFSELRLRGLSEILEMINTISPDSDCESMDSGESSVFDESKVGRPELAAWLLDNSILDHVFGKTMHVELVKRSHDIMRLLHCESLFTNAHLELIWHATNVRLDCSCSCTPTLPCLILLSVSPLSRSVMSQRCDVYTGCCWTWHPCGCLSTSCSI